MAHDVLFPVLGHLIGKASGTRIPVIEGLPPDATEDQLKALGAAAASSGSVALFHAVGVTPEAPDLAAAFAGRDPVATVHVGPQEVARARDDLTTARGGRLRAVTLGTPHLSFEGFAALLPLLARSRVHPEVEFYVNTGRHVLSQIEPHGWDRVLADAGVQIVTDTCTYVTPILRRLDGVVMTDSAKWAYYAPGNLGVEVAFGSTAECVRSSIEGRIVRDEELWRGL